MDNDTDHCRDCGTWIRKGQEKAVGSGEWESVWVDREGVWVCPKTGDEHRPDTAGEPDEAPDTVGYEQVAHMIQDLRTELEDKIETLQREVEELRERLD